MVQCKATSKRSKERCQRQAMRGREVCYMHGGKTPRGVASPHFKGGRHSKSIPTRLAARYEEAREDPDILALGEEIALTDAQISDALARLYEGSDEKRLATKLDLDHLIERRRRLVESELRRRVSAQEMMSAHEVLTFLGAIVGIIRTHVQDKSVLAAIAHDIESLVGSTNGRMVDARGSGD